MSSLRRRLLVGLGLGLGLALALVGVLVYRLEHSSLYAGLDRAIDARTRGLAVLVEQEREGIENDIGRSRQPELARAVRPQYFELWYDDGRVLERSQSLGARDLRPATVPVGGVRITDVTLPDGQPGRQATYRFLPRLDPDDPALAVTPRPMVLAFAQDTLDVEASLTRMRTVLGIAVALAMLLVLGLLVVVLELGLRPVDELTRQIRAIDPRAPQPGFATPALPRELAPIAARLDELMQGLAAAFARERELTAELAHELRTPVTGLKVTLELALSRDRAPADYRAAMRECLVICDQTQRTVEALLTLARLDASLVEPARDELDLAALVTDALPAFARRAEQRDITVKVMIASPDVRLRTDVALVQLVLNNLLDNAVRHADAGGTLEVGVSHAHDAVELHIANTGSQLTHAQAQQATARFWRGDSARVSGVHAGLGLALCLKVTTLLGGTLVLTSALGGWFRATLVLPQTPLAPVRAPDPSGPTAPRSGRRAAVRPR